MQKRLFLILFILMGLAVGAFGGYTAFFETRGFEKTTAVITRIDETFTGYDDDNNPEYSYDVYVDYTVDGKEYSGMSDYYSGSYEEGKEITIYYNPADPTEIHGDAKNFGIYMMIIGPVVSIVALILLLRR
ncbi:MAG: DUF3592 domain-containing protein [Solobacterium sp.]|nr:DUF3592 domain-containing protein [Solobacterium sp.]